jgi:hypothetical protein
MKMSDLAKTALLKLIWHFVDMLASHPAFSQNDRETLVKLMGAFDKELMS